MSKIITNVESEVVVNNEFDFYPNPANSTFIVNTKNVKESSVNLSIVNSLGEIVLQQNIEPNKEVNIDLQGLSKGIYIVRVDSITKKLLLIN